MKNQNFQTLKYNSIRRYKIGLIDIWSYQVLRINHNLLNLNSNTLRSIMKDSSQNQNIEINLALQDWSRETVIDDCDELSLWKIIEEFWKRSYSAKLPVLEGNLQERLDYFFGHFLLKKREFWCFAGLLDWQLLRFNNEETNICPALLQIINNGKTNENDQIKYNGILRHKKLLLCGTSVLALYFF